MDILQAKEILRCLAEGIDPSTGEVLPNESPYNNPDVIRALFIVLSAPEKKSTSPLNAGTPWTPEEDTTLRNEFLSKATVLSIAKSHGRTRGAINSRLKYLGLK